MARSRPFRPSSCRARRRVPAAVLGLVCLAGLATLGCRNTPPPPDARFHVEHPGLTAHYDEQTGLLRRLELDTNQDGRVDTWSYMNGRRVERIEADTTGDGVIDRWEYYTEAHTLEKVGRSRANDGVVDTWTYHDDEGRVARVEISTRRDGAIDRAEIYEHGHLARVESDTVGDGRIDKWETFDPPAEPGGAAVLRSVAFDPGDDGQPTRRILYRPDGSFDRIEELTGA